VVSYHQPPGDDRQAAIRGVWTSGWVGLCNRGQLERMFRKFFDDPARRSSPKPSSRPVVAAGAGASSGHDLTKRSRFPRADGGGGRGRAAAAA
jgi:hypothetical protein